MLVIVTKQYSHKDEPSIKIVNLDDFTEELQEKLRKGKTIVASKKYSLKQDNRTIHGTMTVTYKLS